jgi:hypothetical protein
VRDDKAGRLQFANLCRDFSFNLVGVDPANDRAQREGTEPVVEASVVSLLVRESGSLSSAKDRRAIHEYDVAADPQPGRGLGVRDRILECLTIGHESRGRYDSIAGGFNNGAIHTPSKPEIIRIDNQAPQATV